MAVHDGDGRPRARPDRELARGLGQRHARRARARDRGRGDRRRGRAPDPPLPDRPRRDRRSTRSRPSSPTRRPPPSARASSATRLPRARVIAAPSTAEAVRRSPSTTAPWAALGNRLAAELYGCQVLRAGVEDVPGNETRFVWLGPRRRAAGGPAGRRALGPWKTAIVFWGAGAEAPGWLVALPVGVRRARGVNLTRIESRPRKQGLGRYMFFVDWRARHRAARRRRRWRACARTSRWCACSARSRPPDVDHRLSRSRWPRASPATASGAALHCRHGHGHSVPAPAGSAPPPEHQRRGREVGRVLVLNATYEPINVCTVRRAVVLLLKDKAEVIEHAELGAALGHTRRSPRPVVIRLVSYVRVPRDTHRRKITRRAVFARDDWTCQYCGSRSNLTVDHVIPRSKGGASSWENIVASCAPCNRRKGDALPAPGRHAPAQPAARRRARTSSSTSPARRSRRPGCSTSLPRT